MNMRGA